MSAKHEDALTQVRAVRRALRCNIYETKANVQTAFSRIMESLRNREIFLLNQIDIIYQSSEDLLVEQELLLNSVGPADSTHAISSVSEENGDKQEAGDFAGCVVTFDADLAALRDAVHQFGRVTTSQSLLADNCGVTSFTSASSGYSHSTDDQSVDLAGTEGSRDEFVMVDDRHLSDAEDGEWVDPGVVLTPTSGQHHVHLENLDCGKTVYPEVGVYVTVEKATGQCHVSCEAATSNDEARQVDLAKLASVGCFEASDAIDTLPYASDVSPISGHVVKIRMQPAELWLSCAYVNAVENDEVEVVSSEMEEAAAASSFVRYVESVSAEPLKYWLCPSCQEESHSVQDSFEHVAAENDNHTLQEPEPSVASVTAFIHRILAKPHSYWIISTCADSVSDKSTGLNLSSNLPFCMPCITAISGDPLLQQVSAYASDFWLLPSSSAVDSDQTEIVVNVVNGTSVRFEFKPATSGGDALAKDAVGFNDAYFDYAISRSKPSIYW